MPRISQDIELFQEQTKIENITDPLISLITNEATSSNSVTNVIVYYVLVCCLFFLKKRKIIVFNTLIP